MIALPPESFQLGGRTWTVKMKSRMSAPDKDEKIVYGETHHAECEIWISDKLEGEELYHTFLHELNHAIAGTMGWAEFDNDEGKIDAHAGLLLQFLRTKKGSH